MFFIGWEPFFELGQRYYNKKNLSKFHPNWTKKCAHLSDLVQNITWTNVRTKFHEHKAIHVTSRILTTSFLKLTFWPRVWPNFKLNRYMIETMFGSCYMRIG
ncbi:hypothetical protein DPMN_151685 [Dreissena polymorpha]|uniref:Uncharacterized protein n=1 Tax=Dreissena polymorpha TaxID=45954 RepID=A0A9D4J4H3_DREPO|nr:hypothetical protein DPMN_151685 [Dreissena polymorpha]